MDESWQLKPDDKRRRPRQSVMMQAELWLSADEPSLDVRVRNLSSGGVLVACRATPELGTRVRIKLRGIGEVEGEVRRVSASSIAIRFDETIDPALAKPAPERGRVQILHHVANPRRPGLIIK